METLPIPYLSQLEDGALSFNNDCGAAAGAMILRGYGLGLETTIDQFYLLATNGNRTDRYLSASEIRTVLGKFGLQSTWKVGMNTGTLYAELCAGEAGIALVNYGVLVDAGLTQRKTFRGSHFVVTLGMDIKHVAIHDPYQTGVNGAEVHIPVATFDEAWRRTNEHGNPTRGWLGCERSIYLPVPVAVKQVKILYPMNVRNGPGLNWLTVGALYPGAIVDILEVAGATGDWGRFGVNRWVYIGNKAWTPTVTL